MAEPIPPISVTRQKDIRIVEFTNNRILDEANIAEIGSTLGTLIEEDDQPKLLLDFSTVDHLSSAALGMLINANNKVRERSGKLRLTNIKPQILRGVRHHQAEQAVPDLSEPGGCPGEFRAAVTAGAARVNRMDGSSAPPAGLAAFAGS